MSAVAAETRRSADHRGLKLRVRRAHALWVRLDAALEVRKERRFMVNGVGVAAGNVSWLADDIRERLLSLTAQFNRAAPDLEDAVCAAMAGAIYANVVHAAMECGDTSSWTDADFAEAEIARQLCEQLTALATAIDAANPEVAQ